MHARILTPPLRTSFPTNSGCSPPPPTIHPGVFIRRNHPHNHNEKRSSSSDPIMPFSATSGPNSSRSAHTFSPSLNSSAMASPIGPLVALIPCPPPVLGAAAVAVSVIGFRSTALASATWVGSAMWVELWGAAGWAAVEGWGGAGLVEVVSAE